MKTENRFKVGDYVWFDEWWWDGEIKRIIGRITKIQVDAGVRWYWLDDLRSDWVEHRTKDQITPATDSEVAWFLVTNEN